MIKCLHKQTKVKQESLEPQIKDKEHNWNSRPSKYTVSQFTITNSLNTTHNVTEKNTPRLEHNLITLHKKVRALVSKIPLLITKDGIRNDLEQAAKKSTIWKGTESSSLTKRKEERGHSTLTKIQDGRENSL